MRDADDGGKGKKKNQINAKCGMRGRNCRKWKDAFFFILFMYFFIYVVRLLTHIDIKVRRVCSVAGIFRLPDSQQANLWKSSGTCANARK